MAPIFKQYERDEAPESVREVYDRFFDWRQMVPASFKTLAAVPVLMKTFFDHYEQVFRYGKIPGRTKIIIGIRMTTRNKATYCAASMMHRARQVGIGEDVIEMLATLDCKALPAWSKLSGPEQVAVDFADKMTFEYTQIDEAYYAPLRSHYSDEEILELSCQVGVANYINRLGMALKLSPDKNP